MVFSSTFFLLFFLPVFFTAYLLVPKKGRNTVLFLFSLAFYAYGAPQFIWVLLASSLLNFYAVQWMHEARERPTRRRFWLYFGTVLNVGLLLVFKYANFAVGIFDQLGALDASSWTEIALPIGISFFTFQSLSYNLDVYRGNESPLKSPVHYFIYIFSFPQMIAVLILRFGAVA